MSSQLETERLILRRMLPSDLDPYFNGVFADDAVMRTLPSGAAIDRSSFERVAQGLMVDHWENHGFGPWIVASKETNECLGHCGLRFWPDSEDVEVLYAFARSAWGQGLATEAARASVRYGFCELALERVIAAIVPGNLASRRVLEKIGMRETGPFSFGRLEVLGFELHRSGFRELA